MSSPVTPSQLLATVASGTGDVCQRFAALLKFGQLAHDEFAYERNEQGDITPEFCSDILACAGISGVTPPGGGTGGTLAAPVISASDGTFGDRVRITWNAVSGATQYFVYRATADNPALATQIATSVSMQYDDTTGTIDTTYYYWVKASNGTTTSALSNSDPGYYSTPLGAVSDLECSRGAATTLNPQRVIYMQWTEVPTATVYDIYRHTADDFPNATKIKDGLAPGDNTSYSGASPNGLTDNVTDLTYYDTPPDPFLEYFYWVIGRKLNPNAAGLVSNTGSGWAVGFGEGNTPDAAVHITDVAEHTVPASMTRAWIYMIGGAAGGAGAVLWGELAVAAGGKFQFVATGSAESTAAAETDGADGRLWELKYKPPAGSYATVMTSSAATGGNYNAAGGGTGGTGAVATNDGVISNGAEHDGNDGLPGQGAKGGRSGKIWGYVRTPAAHSLPGFPLPGFSGDGNGAGGSVAVGNPSFLAYATGGKGQTAQASISFSIA